MQRPTSWAAVLAGLAAVSQAGEPPSSVLGPELQPFASFPGQWSCAGEFTASKKPIAARLVFSADLEGSWLALRWDDDAPNQFHALELWGFDRTAHQFSNSIYDSFGGVRTFESRGWAGDTLIWSRELPPNQPFVSERFVIERETPGEFVISWEVRKPRADWTTGDRLTCQRRD
jgi:hypothetical protein